MTVVLSVHDVHTYVRGILIFPDLNHFADISKSWNILAVLDVLVGLLIQLR